MFLITGFLVKGTGILILNTYFLKNKSRHVLWLESGKGFGEGFKERRFVRHKDDGAV